MTQRQSATRYILIGAVIVALVLVVGLYFLTRSSGGTSAGGSATNSQGQTKPLVVAQQSIPAGTTFNEGEPLSNFFRVDQAPPSLVPLGAFSSIQSIANVIKGAGCQPTVQPGCQGHITATQNIYQGLPVVSGMFSALGQFRTAASPAFTIPYGFVAISVDVGATNAVAGSIQPGDSVDLIASYTGNGAKLGIHAPPQTQYIMSDVKVIGIGSVAGPGGTSSTSSASSSNTAAVPGGSLVILARYQQALVLQHLKDFGWQISAVLRSARETAIPHFKTLPVTDRWFFAKASNPFRTNPGY